MISTIRTICATALVVLAVGPSPVGHAQVRSAPVAAASQGAVPSVSHDGQPAAESRKGGKSVFAEDGPVDTTWGAQVESLRHALIEGMLKRRRIPYELRSTSATEICFEVQLPVKTHTDTVTDALKSLSPARTVDVKWEQKKGTK